MPFSFLFVSKGAEKAFSAKLFAYLSENLYFCIEFPKVKICVDCSLVILVVKKVGKHLGWFDHILAYQPGFRRYVYGLAKFLFKQK